MDGGVLSQLAGASTWQECNVYMTHVEDENGQHIAAV